MHNPQANSAEQNNSAPRPANPTKPGQPGTPPTTEYNILAIIAFATSFFCSIAAVICGHIALAELAKTGEKGRGFAVAGTIIGYAGIGITLVMIVGVLIFFSFLNYYGALCGYPIGGSYRSTIPGYLG